MKSIYETMSKNLALIPEKVRIKLFIRHSLRPGVEGVKDKNGKALGIEAQKHWGLTREGKIMAEYFGAGLREDFIIETISTSTSTRCIETAQHILQGFGERRDIIENEILATLWIQDSIKWHKTYESHNKNIRELLQKMLDKKAVLGAYPIEKSIQILLQTMGLFENETDSVSIKPKLDIFVSHDGLIMLLLCFLLQKNINEILWIYMLEGVFLWREDEFLYLAWRGEKLQFDIKELL